MPGPQTVASRFEPSLLDLGSSHAQTAIREQLERILDSPLFRNSKRYPSLLRHVVERTLQGRAEDLRERALAVAVFGRTAAEFDPAVDPVVRTSAGEVRKRIAQYYHDPSHNHELRIELPFGSYVPDFYFPDEPQPEAAPSPPMARRKSRMALAGAVFVVIAAASFAARIRASAIDEFWKPVLGGSEPIILCAARMGASGDVAQDPKIVARGVGWADAVTMTRLAGLLESRGQTYQARLADELGFNEMQQGPTILVGAFNDFWSLRFAETGRYGFARDGSIAWIRDREHPADRRWSVDFSRKDAAGKLVIHEDYAMIYRILRAATGRPLVIVGGLWANGTEAAGQFLCDAKSLQDLDKRAPRNWQTKNLQIVLRADVINGNSGPPELLAVYVW